MFGEIISMKLWCLKSNMPRHAWFWRPLREAVIRMATSSGCDTLQYSQQPMRLVRLTKFFAQ